MNITNKTILVTGGNSGIGFAIAKHFKAQGNQVIITGRDKAKLEKAGQELGVDTIPLDTTSESDVKNLVAIVSEKYKNLSVLVNNAGLGQGYNLRDAENIIEIATTEFATNYFGTIRLTQALLPILKSQPEAAIVNVSSQVAIVPFIVLPTYSDSKAALHSHTKALRLSLSNISKIKVYEVFPALINTAGTRALGLTNGLPADTAADIIANGISQDQYEIFVGDEAVEISKNFYKNPQATLENLNKALY
ncbi:MAG: short-chain dehydrogenase [Pseudopedobacter saltans]|uniref:Short-chain dehydrogenase n=1 Tax=Pseudopedobacter saltans TaxID=151895 RepID=A0A2W5ENX1_9SPHI|nr:MAG: short-chain dehydrogenase [Pseudopedobacter saltans]